MSLKSKIESLLFVSAKALSIKKLAELCQAKEAVVEAVVKELQDEYKKRAGGLQLVKNAQSVALGTAAVNAKLVQNYIKEELTGELTRPSLEALTIIAYRGPISKLELEQIRGVNCSLILRNLLLRGLIEVGDGATAGQAGQSLYSLSFDFLRYLGVSEVNELPDYDKLSSPQLLDSLLNPQSKI